MGGGGGRPAPAPQVNNVENPYDDQWIHEKFATGQDYFDEFSDWMNKRKASLEQGTLYDVGGGHQVKQKDFGKYVTSQLGAAKAQYDQEFARMRAANKEALDKHTNIYNARLGDITAATGANRQSLQAQSEALARAGERNRARSYSGTGGGFNRSGMRIQGLNV